MRTIDADALREKMYHDAFETDSDMQKWESGCWIRYKMFENNLEAAPTIRSTRWIPCSERMPEKSGQYLVTNFEYGNYFTEINIYNADCGGWLHDIIEPVAWAPLPKPWVGEKR